MGSTQETASALRNLDTPMSRPPLRNITESLLILGTALTVYWQPLARQIPAKASDIVFVLALGAWLVALLRKGLPSTLRAAGLKLFVPPLALLGSLLAATLVGYLRYDLIMSREGAILLARLILCVVLFLATYDLSHAGTGFRRRISIAFLAPVVLFPLMLVPALSASQWVQGRFRGLTVNPNTADLGFSVALAIACVLAMYEIRVKRRLLALVFAAVAAGMLVLIMWTQSRSHLAGAFASVVLGGALIAPKSRFPKLGVAAVTALAFLVVAAAGLLLTPHALTRSYIARLSWGTLAPPTSDTQSLGSPGQPTAPGLASLPAFSGSRALARSNWVLTQGRPVFVSGRYGAFDELERLPNGGVRRFMENPHVQAAILYGELLPTNYLGLGVNYEEKFFLYFPWINIPHAGTNSILDIPIYGGVGAVLSIGYLMMLVARKTRNRLETEPDETLPYGIGATAAFVGAWVAAVLLGSPIFDYQFWIVTALALA